MSIWSKTKRGGGLDAAVLGEAVMEWFGLRVAEFEGVDIGVRQEETGGVRVVRARSSLGVERDKRGFVARSVCREEGIVEVVHAPSWAAWSLLATQS